MSFVNIEGFLQFSIVQYICIRNNYDKKYLHQRLGIIGESLTRLNEELQNILQILEIFSIQLAVSQD